MDHWLIFVSTTIWQLMAIAFLIGIYKSGAIQKISELTFPGGFVLKMRAIEQNQELLQREIETLRFLFSGFITEYELVHLQKLAGNAPFPYVWGGDRDDDFVDELIRLWRLGLITRQNTDAWVDIPREGELRNYASITERGRQYIQLYQEFLEDRSNSESKKDS